jgi:hypothetical protein
MNNSTAGTLGLSYSTKGISTWAVKPMKKTSAWAVWPPALDRRQEYCIGAVAFTFRWLPAEHFL